MSYLSELLGTSYKEGMTEEDISNALEKLNKNSVSEADKLKIQLSKANSEAAEYKKQLRAKQTDDEAAAAETKAAIEQLMAENAELKKSMDIANKTAKNIKIETSIIIDSVISSQAFFIFSRVVTLFTKS